MREEIWKSVEGYEGLYEVSNNGRVRSMSRWIKNGVDENKKGWFCGVQLKLQKHWSGYLCVRISGGGVVKNYRVHRLIAKAFVENLNNKKVVNHKNGIKQDNRAENLEWCSSSENNFHAYRTGLKRAARAKAILTEEDVRTVMTLVGRLSNKEIGRMFGVKGYVIYRITRGISWSDITNLNKVSYSSKATLTKQSA